MMQNETPTWIPKFIQNEKRTWVNMIYLIVSLLAYVVSAIALFYLTCELSIEVLKIIFHVWIHPNG